MISWSIRNRVAVNILAVAILILGFYTAHNRLPLDLFPDVSTNFIRIFTLDPTISNAEDVERFITIPIEEEVANVDGILNLISFSEGNLSTVFLEITQDIRDLDPVLNQVRQEVSRARTRLPASIEEPDIREFEIEIPLVTFGVGLPPEIPLSEVRDVLDGLERALRIIPGVSDVRTDGLNRRELWIEVDPVQAELRGFTLAEVAERVRRRSANIVAGTIEGAGGERTIRVLGEVSSVDDLMQLPLREVDGEIVRLTDIATLRETTERPRSASRVNLRSGVTYTLIKRRGADAIEVADRAQEVFNDFAQRLPETVEARMLVNSTKYIDVRIQNVVRNGIQALVIVTLLLMLCLDWRLALVIAVGLPISFAGTFLYLDYRGDTLNLLSLFGLIMALGMIVDDALVVAENSFRYLEQGMSRAEAALRGAREVIWPVLGSVATTVAAFLPLLLAEGVLGQFLQAIPIVVVAALAFSIVQAFLILPSHVVDFLRHPPTYDELARRESNGKSRSVRFRMGLIYRAMRDAVDRFIKACIQVYLHLLCIALRRRYVVIGTFVAMLLLCSVVAYRIVPFQLFSTDFSDQMFVKLELPQGASLEQTEEMVRKIELGIVDLLPEDDFVGIFSQVGGRLDVTNQFFQRGKNLAMITVDLDDSNPAMRLPSVIEREVSQYILSVPGLISATAENPSGGPPVGRAINVRISGPDFAELQERAIELQEVLAELDGVRNLSTDLEVGRPEYHLLFDEERLLRRGLDLADFGLFLQGSFFGLEATRTRWGNDEVILRVLYRDHHRHDPESLFGHRLINQRGEAIPLEEVSDVVYREGLARINRRNQNRTIVVSGDVNRDILTSRNANKWIENYLEENQMLTGQYRYELAGENEDTERSLESMLFAAILAFLLIYVILAVIFNSFAQPFIVMSVIPFGLVGVLGGILFMNIPIGLMSIMGMIALSGIVVNNSVVFLDFINRYRREGHHDLDPEEHLPLPGSYRRWRSILISGRIRARPIFLTSATTIAGLFTLAFLTTGQEQFLSPMAQAIIFGLAFASTITMILIPCLYAILDDVLAFRKRRSLRRSSEG